MATQESDFQIMDYLASSGIYINHQNNDGLRAIDCLTKVVSEPANSLMSEHTASLVATLRCLFLLLCHGSMPYSMLT